MLIFKQRYNIWDGFEENHLCHFKLKIWEISLNTSIWQPLALRGYRDSMCNKYMQFPKPHHQVFYGFFIWKFGFWNLFRTLTYMLRIKNMQLFLYSRALKLFACTHILDYNVNLNWFVKHTSRISWFLKRVTFAQSAKGGQMCIMCNKIVFVNRLPLYPCIGPWIKT